MNLKCSMINITKMVKLNPDFNWSQKTLSSITSLIVVILQKFKVQQIQRTVLSNLEKRQYAAFILHEWRSGAQTKRQFVQFETDSKNYIH